MKNSLFGLVLMISIVIFLIFRMRKGSNSQKYEARARDKWNLLSDGKDPTDDHA
jgi:hypothetical protein